MELDVLGLFSACSYALDCVEAELVHVTSKHAKRVAYMSVCVAEQMGIQGKELQDLAVCALLHDNALTQYIQEELHNDIARASAAQEFPRLGAHCSMGEHNIQGLPFHTDVTNVILYHHENADGTGPFGKKWEETPLFARIIHLCDLLDVACRTQTFTTATWEKGLDFLQKAKGRMFDAECVNAFLKSFSEAHFLSLGSRDLDACLWNKIPRIRQELTFSQIKVLADLHILSTINRPLPAPIPSVLPLMQKNWRATWDSMKRLHRKCIWQVHYMISERLPSEMKFWKSPAA